MMNNNTPHPLTNNIPSNAEHILGRETELKSIATLLSMNKLTILVNGIGGMGKTSVATKFIALYGHAYQYIGWVTVQKNLVDAFINHSILLDSLDIGKKVQDLVASQQSDKAFECIMHQLNLLEKTLIVIDNANNLADLLEYKHLFDNTSCHFIITSRNRPLEWATVPIESLPNHEAVELFKSLAPSIVSNKVVNKPTDTDIENLLSKLYFHTLLIELVAKAVASSGISFGAINAMIETKFIHHEELSEEIVSTGRHGDSLAENAKRTNIENYIWLIFNQVTGLSETSKDILRGMSLLPLAMGFERKELKDFFEVMGIKDIVHPLAILVERGWLDKEDGEKATYKMHPLIADVVIKHLGVNATFADAYINHTARLIHYSNINPEHDLFTINKNKPFAERLSDLFFEDNTEEVSELLGNLGYLAESFGFYQKSADLKERALEIAEMIFDKNHSTVAVSQSNLANVYSDLGRYDKAAELLETALESAEKNFGKDHPTVAVSQSNLAWVHKNIGQDARAKELWQSAYQNYLNNLGAEHPHTISFKQWSEM